MKNFSKFFLIVVWAILILGAGYYFVVNNLCSLLAMDKPGLLCEYNASRILIKTGQFVEVVNLDIPVKISRNQGNYTLKSGYGTLTVSARPKFKIRWQKKL